MTSLVKRTRVLAALSDRGNKEEEVEGTRASRFSWRAPKVATLLVVFVLSLAGAGLASAACDAHIGSQFSNSSPNIAVTANNNGVFPGHISVGGFSWATSGGVTNLDGTNYLQHYTFTANSYTVGSNPTVQFTFGSTAGQCASHLFSQSILVVS
jgi:hypothetical protein